MKNFVMNILILATFFAMTSYGNDANTSGSRKNLVEGPNVKVGTLPFDLSIKETFTGKGVLIMKFKFPDSKFDSSVSYYQLTTPPDYENNLNVSVGTGSFEGWAVISMSGSIDVDNLDQTNAEGKYVVPYRLRLKAPPKRPFMKDFKLTVIGVNNKDPIFTNLPTTIEANENGVQINVPSYMIPSREDTSILFDVNAVDPDKPPQQLFYVMKSITDEDGTDLLNTARERVLTMTTDTGKVYTGEGFKKFVNAKSKRKIMAVIAVKQDSLTNTKEFTSVLTIITKRSATTVTLKRPPTRTSYLCPMFQYLCSENRGTNKNKKIKECLTFPTRQTYCYAASYCYEYEIDIPGVVYGIEAGCDDPGCPNGSKGEGNCKILKDKLGDPKVNQSWKCSFRCCLATENNSSRRCVERKNDASQINMCNLIIAFALTTARFAVY